MINIWAESGASRFCVKYPSSNVLSDERHFLGERTLVLIHSQSRKRGLETTGNVINKRIFLTQKLAGETLLGIRVELACLAMVEYNPAIKSCAQVNFALQQYNICTVTVEPVPSFATA
jgi:hypothetical protein